MAFHISTIIQLIEQGFSLEIGHWPDTPLQQDDQLLGMDSYGLALIARAPMNADG